MPLKNGANLVGELCSLLGPWSPAQDRWGQIALYSSASASQNSPACAALHSLCLSHFVSTMPFFFCLHWFPPYSGTRGISALRQWHSHLGTTSQVNVKCSCAPLQSLINTVVFWAPSFLIPTVILFLCLWRVCCLFSPFACSLDFPFIFGSEFYHAVPKYSFVGRLLLRIYWLISFITCGKFLLITALYMASSSSSPVS